VIVGSQVGVLHLRGFAAENGPTAGTPTRELQTWIGILNGQLRNEGMMTDDFGRLSERCTTDFSSRPARVLHKYVPRSRGQLPTLLALLSPYPHSPKLNEAHAKPD